VWPQNCFNDLISKGFKYEGGVINDESRIAGQVVAKFEGNRESAFSPPPVSLTGGEQICSALAGEDNSQRKIEMHPVIVY
jgi:hypothetical protein